MNKVISILLGLLFLILAIYAWGVNLAGFGSAAVTFLKGGIMWLVLGLGVLLVFLGISELK